MILERDRGYMRVRDKLGREYWRQGGWRYSIGRTPPRVAMRAAQLRFFIRWG